jgi:uncharacterized membrane protein
MQWYYAVNGQQQGPVEQEALFEMAKSGTLKPDDLVWNSTLGSQWIKAGTVAGMFVQSATGTTPPPSVWSPSVRFRSQTHNRDLMTDVRQKLQGNWLMAITGHLLLRGLPSAFISFFYPFFMVPVLGWGVGLLIGLPLFIFVVAPLVMFGSMKFFLVAARGEKMDLNVYLDGCKDISNICVANLLVGILVFLWSLLLIIPGIIASFRYAMVFYILSDNPGLDSMEAIRRSKQMMTGNKWKLFCMEWRFFWWALLSLLTFGIGFLWLVPYMMTSMAAFYEDLKKGQSAS